MTPTSPLFTTLHLLHKAWLSWIHLQGRLSNLLERWRLAAERQLFLWSGRPPMGRGYAAYRTAFLQRALSSPTPMPLPLPPGFGAGLDERAVEYPWLFNHLPAGAGRLLDAGSVLNTALVLTHAKLRDKKITITTLAPEDQAHWWKGVSYTYEDIRALSFQDATFDWVVCLSTLEHVGMDNTQFYSQDPSDSQPDPDGTRLFLAQCKRVLKAGGVLWLSVPFGEARSHGWFRVFSAQDLDAIRAQIAPTEWNESIFLYRNHQWELSNREAAATARYFDHRVVQPNPGKVAAAEAVACIEIRF